MGGEHEVKPCYIVERLGSSPRGRGTLFSAGHATRRDRFIPAWAGNTSACTMSSATLPVHPRAGGEHALRDFLSIQARGSSPRGRGTHLKQALKRASVRFIPASAGNTRSLGETHNRHTVHPRVGGEHASRASKVARSVGSSPRGRGTPGKRSSGRDAVRFIPAWAGNTARHPSQGEWQPVHPRVGGEHAGCA